MNNERCRRWHALAWSMCCAMPARATRLVSRVLQNSIQRMGTVTSAAHQNHSSRQFLPWTTSRQSTRRPGQLASHVRGEKQSSTVLVRVFARSSFHSISLIHLCRQRGESGDRLGVPDARYTLYIDGLAIHCVL